MRGFSRFHPQFSAGMVSLYSNRLIIQFGAGLIGLFLPIFLYESFGNDPTVLLWYFMINFGLTVFLFVPGAKLMNKIGLKWMMILAVLSYGLCHGFYAFFDNFENVWLFLGIALTLNNIWRMLYWTPFHTEFAEFTDRRHRGRTIGFLSSISSLVSIAVPFVAGFIIVIMPFQNRKSDVPGMLYQFHITQDIADRIVDFMGNRCRKGPEGCQTVRMDE